MKNIKTLLIILFLGCSLVAFAQEEENEKRDKRPERTHPLEGIVFGGNVGLGYANGWRINASPSVGYRITDNFIGGVGFNYTYSEFRNPFSQYDEKYTVTGGRAFLQHLIAFNIYAMAEYEYLTGTFTVTDRISNVQVQQGETSAPGLLFGGGYNANFGFGFGGSIEILYNILHTSDTPYSSPLVYRFGFTLGF